MRTSFRKCVLNVVVGTFFLSLPTQALGQVYRAGEVIVKLKANSKSVTAAAFVGKVYLEKQMELKKSWNALNMYHFKSTAGHSTQQLVDMYKSDPAVEYVEPNYIFSKLDIQSEAVTGLSASDVQTQAAGDYSQNLAPISVKSAWTVLSSGKAKPIVAVIDTGVDYNHVVFTQSGSIWSNTDEIAGNGIDDDGNGFIDDVRGWNFASNNNDPMDDNNHGTHVAGIVLGIGQDIIDTVPRAASRIEIMPLKFLDSSGSGSTSAAVAAVMYAVNNGAKVINNSWGGPSYSTALHEALVFAYNSKVFVVSAAGNASNNNDISPLFPANYDVPGNASIAATTDSDALAFFSNFGSGTVHVGSPGSGIKSTLPGNTFGFLSGTSMACPIVAGIAALVMYEQPTMTGFQVSNIIFAQSQSILSLDGKVTTKSRVNVLNAVTGGQSAGVELGQPAYSVGSSKFSSRSVASNPIEETGGCGLVGRALSGSASGGFPLSGLLLFVPLVLLMWMRTRRSSADNRRRFERFTINTDVVMNVGGRQLSGVVNSISQGGVRVNVEDMIEKGSVVTLNITSPDGQEKVEVQGHIVWSETEQQSVGVKFGANQLARATVAAWTGKLKAEPDN